MRNRRLFLEPLEDRSLLAAVITVNSTTDANTRDAVLSLREAIEINNFSLLSSSLTVEERAQINGILTADTTDTIAFNIPGSGVRTISPTTALPATTQPVIIDGYTQPGAEPNTSEEGWNGTLLIELDGVNAGATSGLRINGGNSTVRGLIIGRFQFGAGGGAGISLAGPNATVQGNFIGLSADGMNPQGNGIGVLALNRATIGGVSPAARNVISGNEIGIYVDQAADLVIQGNIIGPDAMGNAGLVPNSSGSGIYLRASIDTVIGGTQPGAGNVISGNGNGITTFTQGPVGCVGLVVQGNKIGTDATGTVALGNNVYGIHLSGGSQSTIGGTAANSGNVITNNRGGIYVGRSSEAIAILGNSIFDNFNPIENQSDLGIDLADEGTTPNDLTPTPDADAGANNLQNFPVISAAVVSNAGLTVQYIVPSATDNSTYPLRVEFFKADSDGQEGQRFLGFDTYTGAEAGTKKTSTVTLASSVSAGDKVVSTATDDDGNTSEFSASVTVEGVLCSTIVLNNNDADAGSLREAINCANLRPGSDTISFSIPEGGVRTIRPTSSLPQITDQVIIDGYTQPGASRNSLPLGMGTSAQLRIEISGANAGPTSGIRLVEGSGGSRISGLVVNGFQLNGILIESSGNTIDGNFIGTNTSGTLALANAHSGVLVEASSANVIGGSSVGERNLISANGFDGVRIFGSAASGNLVSGNVIGTDASGTERLGNVGYGIFISGAHDNVVGGANSADGNLISGNKLSGIGIFGTTAGQNAVQGNLIGTNALGTQELGNDNHGVAIIDAPGNLVGGPSVNEGNLIAGNDFSGVAIVGTTASGNFVQANRIGTNALGTEDLGNTHHGVWINGAPGNLVGGSTVNEGNLISGNDFSGVGIFGAAATGNVIAANFIGTTANAAGALPNTSQGVLIDHASDNRVGGTSQAERNVVAFNLDAGIWIVGGRENAISGNSVFLNGRIGIDLFAPSDTFPGVTSNDGGDADTGSNNLQNFPELSAAAISQGTLTVQYVVPSATENSTYPLRIEFFKADSEGQEGETFLGFGTYTAAEAGVTKTFSFASLAAVASGDRIVATATDGKGNTSEFSEAFTVLQGNSCSLAVSNTFISGPGSLRSAITCANTNGSDDLIVVPAGEYRLSGSASEDANAGGDLDLTEANRSVTILGTGADQTLIIAAINDRGVHVLQNVTAVLESLSISGGTASTGGGVLNVGKLTLNDVTVRNNTATTGGGIRNGGELTLHRSGVQDNIARSTSSTSPVGGGIYATADTANAFVVIVDSMIERNSVTISGSPTNAITARGGGVASQSVPVTVLRSAIRENSIATSLATTSAVSGSVLGGGIYVSGAAATITASEVSQNSAISNATGSGLAIANGGGIYLTNGSLTIETGSAIVENQAVSNSTTTGSINAFAGGVYFSTSTNNNALSISDSEISRNVAEVTTATTSNLSAGGGAINTIGGVINISRTTIDANEVTGSRFSSGGGLRFSSFTEPLTPSTVTMTDVTLSQNLVEASVSSTGGGFYALSNVNVNVLQSTIDGNRVNGPGGGGGAYFSGLLLTVIGSTISGNKVNSPMFAAGGGIQSGGALTLVNSTISGNTAIGTTSGTSTSGGITTANKPVLIRSSTITGNRAIPGQAGGLYANAVGSTKYVTMHNTIVAGNFGGIAGTLPADISGSVNVGTAEAPTSFNNLIGDTATSGGLVNGVNGNKVGNNGSGTIDINSVLNTTLADNGGPTLTHALVADSPAINAGSNGQALDAQNQPLATDQRGNGFDRIEGNTVDIGAFEFPTSFPWHNLAEPFDVRGGSSVEPDGEIDAGDALAIINYINAFQSGPIPENAALGLPFGYLDTDQDNSVTAGDALRVINAINAEGEGEASAEFGMRNSEWEAADGAIDREELMGLLAADAAEQLWRRRRG